MKIKKVNEKTFKTKEKYYIEENGELFGIIYNNKQIAIDTYIKHINEEKKCNNEYWNNHVAKHLKYIQEEKVKVITIIEKIEINKCEEFLIDIK